jgi:hypothetical protein
VAQFGAQLSEDPSESQVQGFQRRKGQMREETQAVDLDIDNIKQQRKNIQHHIALTSLPREERFTRLRTERKHFIDTLKMIAYRAEAPSLGQLGPIRQDTVRQRRSGFQIGGGRRYGGREQADGDESLHAAEGIGMRGESQKRCARLAL